MAILLILAEVSDKLGDPAEGWVIHLLAACLCFGLSLWSKRLLVLLALGTTAYACCNNLLWDDWFRSAIINEVGYGYVAKAIGVTCTPLLGVVASVPLHVRIATRRLLYGLAAVGFLTFAIISGSMLISLPRRDVQKWVVESSGCGARVDVGLEGTRASLRHGIAVKFCVNGHDQLNAGVWYLCPWRQVVVSK